MVSRKEFECIYLPDAKNHGRISRSDPPQLHSSGAVVLDNRKAMIIVCHSWFTICYSFLYDSIRIGDPSPSAKTLERLFNALHRPQFSIALGRAQNTEESDRVYGDFIRGLIIPGRISKPAFPAFLDVLDVCPSLTLLQCDLEIIKDSKQ